jgi:hypothetical protein
MKITRILLKLILLNLYYILLIFINWLPASEKSHCVSITKANRLMAFRKLIAENNFFGCYSV